MHLQEQKKFCPGTASLASKRRDCCAAPPLSFGKSQSIPQTLMTETS